MAVFPEADALYFLPLGGTGEIGMNLNLYGHDGTWIMVDCGVTFEDARAPGAEVVMADPSYIIDRRDQLAGIVLTHAHEDHLGAVPYLWEELRCPVYATPFTAAFLRRKLAEEDLLDEVPLTEIPLSGRFTLGPFEIELVTLTHSIPEPNALVIHTSLGKVLHTGDWKLDPEPLVGENYDADRLRALADEGVLAMVCDSTNALVEGESGSESEVREALLRLVSGLKHRVAVGCFASNIARLETIAEVARQTGRRLCLAGRSLHRMLSAAQEAGYMKDFPRLVAEDEVGYLPREEVLMICTGSQGEPRSALARIVRGDHPHITLEEGDAVVFSSRVIPGNEVAIFDMQNRLVERGIEIFTDDDHPIHVSGHPARDELTQMYSWVRPHLAIPVHGEPRHLREHAKLAADCQVPRTLVCANGDLIRLAPGEAEVVEQVPSGRWAVDGRALRPIGDEVFRDRLRVSFNGAVLVTVAVDGKGRLVGAPIVTPVGLVDAELEADILEEAVDAAESAAARLSGRDRKDDARLHEAVRVAVRRVFRGALDKRPVTRVHIVRV